MIYLRPVGGLCNRIGAIDSVIEISNILKKKITIIWVLSPELNANFSAIYNTEALGDNVRIIEVKSSKSFYFKAFSKILNEIEKLDNTERIPAIYKWGLKFFLKSRKLHVSFNNNELFKIINKDSSEDNVPVENVIYEKLESALKQHESVYIESCYRVRKSEVRPTYSRFDPKLKILKRVDQISCKFGNTIGVHIRRTDHHYAIKNSPTSLFLKIIEKHLKQDAENTVFLCTDDKKLKDSLMQKYPDKILTADITSLSRNEQQGIEDALVDLLSLSRTKKVYGSDHSSFSQTAADIGGIDIETVIESD